MSTNPLSHPILFVELGLLPGLIALLWAALLFPSDRLLVGVLLGLLAGVLLGCGVTLLAARRAVTQASRPAPVALLDEPIDAEFHVVVEA